jgi:hypothetical protein
MVAAWMSNAAAAATAKAISPSGGSACGSDRYLPSPLRAGWHPMAR